MLLLLLASNLVISDSAQLETETQYSHEEERKKSSEE
jgi:hypothetical protein